MSIGAIKRKYATPGKKSSRNTKKQLSPIDDLNEYDLEDSFIDDKEDESLSDFSDEEEVKQVFLQSYKGLLKYYVINILAFFDPPTHSVIKLDHEARPTLNIM